MVHRARALATRSTFRSIWAPMGVAMSASWPFLRDKFLCVEGKDLFCFRVKVAT